MKKWLALLAAAAMLAFGTADAARLGGGMSLGRQVSVPTMRAPAAKAPAQRTAAPQQQAKRPAAAPAAKPASPWKGALMGIAGALGFMALAHALGLGAEAGTMLMFAALAMLAFLAFSMFRRRQAAPQSGMGQAAPEPMQHSASAMMGQGAAEPAARGSVMDEFNGGASADGLTEVVLPADFDKDGFLENAKINYMRLQHAWCSGNVADLSSFTTEDVFIAITHQLHQRGSRRDEISCRELRAELLAMQQDSSEYVASVLFDGILVDNGQEEAVREIWHLVKPVEGKGGWLLAGIQPAEESSEA